MRERPVFKNRLTVAESLGYNTAEEASVRFPNVSVGFHALLS